MHKTIFDSDFEIIDDDLNFDYQNDLTIKLDSDLSDFDQNNLNEIVLWKVNRHAKFDKDLIEIINSIKHEQKSIDIEKTKLILKGLIKTNGVQLAMASTILRFRNSNIYQIIDQRVFRIIYQNQTLKLKTSMSEENLDYQIGLYLQYLIDLREVCSDLEIPRF